MLRSMFYMATAVLLSTKTARSGSYLKTEERKKASSSYRYTRYQVFPNYRTLEPHVTCILERIVDWYCTTSMIAHERKKLEKDDILNYPPPVGTIHSHPTHALCDVSRRWLVQCGTIRAIDALLGLVSVGLNRKAWRPGGSIKRGVTQANAHRNCSGWHRTGATERVPRTGVTERVPQNGCHRTGATTELWMHSLQKRKNSCWVRMNYPDWVYSLKFIFLQFLPFLRNHRNCTVSVYYYFQNTCDMGLKRTR